MASRHSGSRAGDSDGVSKEVEWQMMHAMIGADLLWNLYVWWLFRYLPLKVLVDTSAATVRRMLKR